VGGWVVGWLGGEKLKLKLNSAQLELELGLSLAISDILIFFVFSLKILCIIKLESSKGKGVRKTLKIRSSHYYTIHTYIKLNFYYAGPPPLMNRILFQPCLA
jgi:hypothetical protein